MAINIIIRNPFDLDAREYFARATITDSLAKKQINEFVRGVKNMGLWGNMTCWPLRANQNAGTGTIAYSLGSDTKDGTLVNGPSWGAGLVFNNATQLLNAGTVDIPSPCAFIAIVKYNTAVPVYARIVGFNIRGYTSAIWFYMGGNDVYPVLHKEIDGDTNKTNISFATNHYNTIYYSTRIYPEGSVRATYTNSKRVDVASVNGKSWNDSPSNMNLKISSYNSNEATFYFLAIIKGAVISDYTDAALYSLIQNTLGSGLTIL